VAAAQDLSHLDVLVTDVVMPGVMGGAVARAVAGIFPDPRVLLISGYIDDPSVIDNVASGTWAYLAKPFTMVQICEAVDQLARARR